MNHILLRDNFSVGLVSAHAIWIFEFWIAFRNKKM